MLDQGAARRAGAWRCAADAGRWTGWIKSCGWVLRMGFCPTGWRGARMTRTSRPADHADVAANGPACVMAVDGAEVTPDEVAALERVCIMFDGNDGDALNRARPVEGADRGRGAAQYWSEESRPLGKEGRSLTAKALGAAPLGREAVALLASMVCTQPEGPAQGQDQSLRTVFRSGRRSGRLKAQ